jgi:hypothetical protein
LANGQSGPCHICGDDIGDISDAFSGALGWEHSVTEKSWGMASFSETWFVDALQSAQVKQGRDAIKQVIVLFCLFC